MEYYCLFNVSSFLLHLSPSDLFISDKKYAELRLKEESSLAIKDLVSMRVFEVVKPLREQVDAAQNERRFLSESKSSQAKELAQLKDELGRQIEEKRRLVKSVKDLEMKLKDAEERIKQKDFKRVFYLV